MNCFIIIIILIIFLSGLYVYSMQSIDFKDIYINSKGNRLESFTPINSHSISSSVGKYKQYNNGKGDFNNDIVIKENFSTINPSTIKNNNKEKILYSKCPKVLIKKDNLLLLYNSYNFNEEEPVVFNNLDEYINYYNYKKSIGIDCPILFLQQENDLQGNNVYRLRPSPFNQQGGMFPLSVPSFSLTTSNIKEGMTPMDDSLSPSQEEYDDIQSYNPSSLSSFVPSSIPSSTISYVPSSTIPESNISSLEFTSPSSCNSDFSLLINDLNNIKGQEQFMNNNNLNNNIFKNIINTKCNNCSCKKKCNCSKKTTNSCSSKTITPAPSTNIQSIPSTNIQSIPSSISSPTNNSTMLYDKNNQYQQTEYQPIQKIVKQDLTPTIHVDSAVLISSGKTGLQDIPKNLPSVPKAETSIDDNAPYNVNDYPPFDPLNQYVGSYTKLDQIHDSTGLPPHSDNAMDPNWGGIKYTNQSIDSGKYADNNIFKPMYTQNDKVIPNIVNNPLYGNVLKTPAGAEFLSTIKKTTYDPNIM